MTVMKVVERRLRAIVSLAIAVLFTGGATASGICAVLCEVQACGSRSNCPPEPKSCCEATKQPDQPMSCCDWFADQQSLDQAGTSEFQVPTLDIPIIEAPSVDLHRPAIVRHVAVLLPDNERGPPGPERSTSHARAPPVCSV